jgi:hypothetical protein
MYSIPGQGHLNQYPMQHPHGINPSIGLGFPGQNSRPHAARPAPAPRERKALLIVDPKTKKPIDECLALQSSTPESDNTTTAQVQGQPQTVQGQPQTVQEQPQTVQEQAEHQTTSDASRPSTLRATSAVFVYSPSVASSPKQGSPPPPLNSPNILKSPPRSPPAIHHSSPKLLSPNKNLSPKAKSPLASPKIGRGSFMFGTVEVSADENDAPATKNVAPPGLEELESGAQNGDDSNAKPVLKRSYPRLTNPTPRKNGKLCYSLEFLFRY